MDERKDEALAPKVEEEIEPRAEDLYDDEEPGEEDDYTPEDDDLKAKVKALPEPVWRKIQIAMGVLIGVGAGLLMFFVPETATFGQYKMIITVVLVILLPRLIETQLGRKFREGRLAMLAVFGVCLVIALIQLAQHGMS